MKTALFFLSSLALAMGASVTPEELAAEALRNNPELRFLEGQVAALPHPAATRPPEIPQPLDFPAVQDFRRALLNLDAELARLYLREFRFILEGTVRLRAMEYAAASEEAAAAGDLSHRIPALVRMLGERPAGGVEALIERRILEGAVLPIRNQAAEARVRRDRLRTELNGLTGRTPDVPLEVTSPWRVPPKQPSGEQSSSLLMNIRKAEIARGLSGFDPAAGAESFTIGGWFTREGLGAGEPISGLTHPGPTAGSSPQAARERLLADARTKLARETLRRRAAWEAAREVAAAIPPELIGNLRAALDLAERQYRVGALDVNLLIEAQREFLEALRIRNEAILQAWRNHLDLEFLMLPAGQPNPSSH